MFNKKVPEFCDLRSHVNPRELKRDQIWRNFGTLAKVNKSWSNF